MGGTQAGVHLGEAACIQFWRGLQHVCTIMAWWLQTQEACLVCVVSPFL